MQGTAGKGQGGKEGNKAVGGKRVRNIVLFVEGLSCSVFGTYFSGVRILSVPSIIGLEKQCILHVFEPLGFRIGFVSGMPTQPRLL